MDSRIDPCGQDLFANGPAEILPFLFLGDIDHARSPETLATFGITRVVSLLTAPEPSTTLFLRANDHEAEDIRLVFDEACAFLDAAREDGCSVLVHCVAGKSRSVTVVLAYLMRAERLPLSDAFERVKRARPQASPNPGFWAALVAEEAGLFGSAAANSEEPPRQARPASECYDTFLEAFQRGARADQAAVLEVWPASGCAGVTVTALRAVDKTAKLAPAAAVALWAALVEAGKLAKPDVAQGLKCETVDLDDYRLDCPRLDMLLDELRALATQADLL